MLVDLEFGKGPDPGSLDSSLLIVTAPGIKAEALICDLF